MKFLFRFPKLIITFERLKRISLTWGLVAAASVLALRNIGPAYHEIEYVCAIFFPIGYWPLRIWVSYSFWPAFVFATFWVAWTVHTNFIVESFQDSIRMLVLQARGIQNDMLAKIAENEKNIIDKDETIRTLHEQIAQFNIAKENKKTPKKIAEVKSEEN